MLCIVDPGESFELPVNGIIDGDSRKEKWKFTKKKNPLEIKYDFSPLRPLLKSCVLIS